jgi:hypothetical protein
MWKCWTDPITTIVSLDMLRVGKSSQGVNKDFIGTTLEFIDTKLQLWNVWGSWMSQGSAIRPPRSYDNGSWHGMFVPPGPTVFLHYEEYNDSQYISTVGDIPSRIYLLNSSSMNSRWAFLGFLGPH